MILASAWVVGDGAGGLTYAAFYALAAAVGLPLGFKLFGRHQPAGWVAGALIGYVLTAFGLWAAIAAGAPSRLGFLVAWLAVGASTLALGRRRPEPPIALPAWNARATAALVFVLLLTLVLAVPPFARVGERDESGNRVPPRVLHGRFRVAYRLDCGARQVLDAAAESVPRIRADSLLLAVLPAARRRLGGRTVERAQRGVLFEGERDPHGAALHLIGVHARVDDNAPAVGDGGCGLARSSRRQLRRNVTKSIDCGPRGQSLSALRDTNIDAITDWHFGGHRIDGLPRCLWYVPQHSMAYALGLVSLTAVSASGATGSLTAIALEGLALGGAVAINPFVGGIFAFVWGLSAVLDALRTRASVATVARHAAAAIPVGLALLWCVSSRMVEGAGGVLEIGLKGASLHAPLLTLFLSLGPVLLPVLAACALLRHDSFRALVPAILLSAVALAVMFLVRLRVDVAWVAFRGGQMFLVSAPALIGYGLSVWLRSSLRIVAATGVRHAAPAGTPNDNRRRLQRAGHHQPEPRRGIPLDGRALARTTAGASLDPTRHSP